MNGMDFAASINKKEVGGQADKEERSANHLDFVGSERGDELRRKILQTDPEDGRKQTAGAGEHQHWLAVNAGRARLTCRQLQKRGKDVKIWNQLENDRQREHRLECCLHAGEAKEHARRARSICSRGR